MKDFENKLLDMSKPEIKNLKHQDMLSEAISKAKDHSVLSLWWLSIPLYLIAALIMKSLFMPGTSLASNLHELSAMSRISSILFFLLTPMVFIIINIFVIRKVYFLSGSPDGITFLKAVWFNILIIMSSILILIIFAL